MRENRIIRDCEIPVFESHEISADLYRGSFDSPGRPCIVFLHGGGFVGGDKRQFSGMAAYLSLSLNAVCISINYRTASQNIFPSAVIDCLGTCRWADENRERLKIGRFYLAGGSPGANIAAMAAVNGRNILEGEKLAVLKSPPEHAILLNPILDMNSFYEKNPIERGSVDQYLGRDSAELRKEASPLSYPRGGLSFLILQGDDDRIVGNEALKEMKKRFVQAGSVVFVETFPNESHGWFNDSAKMDNVVHAIENYICKAEGKHLHGNRETGKTV